MRPPALRSRARARHRVPGPAVLLVSYLAGSIPVSNLVARARAGVDLRDVGGGTVSGSSLYAAAGFGPLALAGVAELAKGACGPLLAGRQRNGLGAGAAALAIVGHNWSPMLSGQGGRGVSLALGATAAAAPEGAVLLVCGLALGKLAHATGIGTLAALAALPLLLSATRGRDGALFGTAVALPILAKRLLGNDGRLPSGRAQLASRFLADREVVRR